MTMHEMTELRNNLAALRDQAFDLVARVHAASRTGDRPLASAMSELQAAANRLGAAESLLVLERRAA